MPDENGELTPGDVESYTKGRLSAEDPEVQRVLNSALSALRRYCGWHVTPSLTETITLDGNDRHELWLPTLKLISVNSATVFDHNLNTTVDIDVNDPTQFATSSRIPGVIYRGTFGRWNWGIGNVTVNYTHGFTDAYDWQGAVLELVDRMTSNVGMVIGNSGPVVAQKVDDVEVRWADRAIGPDARLFYGIDHSLVDHYRLLPFA